MMSAQGAELLMAMCYQLLIVTVSLWGLQLFEQVSAFTLQDWPKVTVGTQSNKVLHNIPTDIDIRNVVLIV